MDWWTFMWSTSGISCTEYSQLYTPSHAGTLVYGGSNWEYSFMLGLGSMPPSQVCESQHCCLMLLWHKTHHFHSLRSRMCSSFASFNDSPITWKELKNKVLKYQAQVAPLCTYFIFKCLLARPYLIQKLFLLISHTNLFQTTLMFFEKKQQSDDIKM